MEKEDKHPYCENGWDYMGCKGKAFKRKEAAEDD